MSRRLLLAAGGSAAAGGDGIPDGEPGTTPLELPSLSYAIPPTIPYNVPQHTVTATADGTGQTIHPDVVDFGASPFNGYRFWMASTAFFQAEPERENPHIHCSNDGVNWVVPAGLTNPIDPWPGAATSDTGNYNSDTDLHYDPADGKLVCTWREVSGAHQLIYLSTSSNGSTWSAPVLILDAVDGGGLFATVSQSLIKVSSTEWRLYFAGGSWAKDLVGGKSQWCRYFSSTTRTGPFTSPQLLSFSGATGTDGPYHGDVIYKGGVYYGIMQQNGKEYPSISADGVNFTVRPEVLLPGTYGSLTQTLYRSTMQIDPNGTTVHVWYSGQHAVSGRWVYYTRVPLTRWTVG